MITWIDEESKQEHVGPSAWEKASKSTIRRNPCRARRPMGPYAERNPKPLYRAVTHASLRLFSCNVACLHHGHHPLSPLEAALSNTDQFLFFDRSDAAVLAAARRSLANSGKKGVSDYVVVSGMLKKPCLSLSWLSLIAANRQLSEAFCSGYLATR